MMADDYGDIEILYYDDQSEVGDCFYDNADDALSDLALKLTKGYKVDFISLKTRVYFDVKEKEFRV